METGFTKLMNPEGIALVAAAMLFTLAFIVMGGTFARLAERQRKARKEAQQKELDDK